MASSVPEKIRNILLPITESLNAFIVDIVLRGERSSKVIEIYVDTDTGISLDQCAEISRALSEKLDAEDFIEGRYRLDVSSPGLDRPLTAIRQYRKNLGRTCKIRRHAEGGQAVIEGKLSGVSEQNILIRKNGNEIAIPFAEIIESHIIPQIT